uniref:Uncharacterized protein LOC117353422 n=1 Tax=Geotrypetes seraphini TaxID=260995 RepID=A0A6P8QEM5_GEOSA|nr:uncharacterized protein LOC117353422 [Geotrypetes seraphini]XP_033785232.1 uncharacterized protein LOC117353422 [Geotrypetes seraphini]
MVSRGNCVHKELQEPGKEEDLPGGRKPKGTAPFQYFFARESTFPKRVEVSSTNFCTVPSNLWSILQTSGRITFGRVEATASTLYDFTFTAAPSSDWRTSKELGPATTSVSGPLWHSVITTARHRGIPGSSGEREISDTARSQAANTNKSCNPNCRGVLAVNSRVLWCKGIDESNIEGPIRTTPLRLECGILEEKNNKAAFSVPT